MRNRCHSVFQTSKPHQLLGLDRIGLLGLDRIDPIGSRAPWGPKGGDQKEETIFIDGYPLIFIDGYPSMNIIDGYPSMIFIDGYPSMNINGYPVL